jgi:uncharacterized membrane protein
MASMSAEATVRNAPRSEHSKAIFSESTAREGVAAARVVYAAAGVWAAIFGGVGILRHVSFYSGHFDLGNMTQAVWSTGHGRFLETTEMVSGVQFSRLGAHVDPILAAFVPLLLVFRSPLIFVVVQAVALALGALPVFWLARKHLASPEIAARFAAVYLLYPTVQWGGLDDFHPVTLSIPLILFAIWYLDEDNFLAFLPFALLAVATKEQMGLVVGSLGIWYAVRKGRRALGGMVAAAGVAWFALAVFVIIPRYAPAGVDLFADRFGGLGDSPSELLRTMVTDPMRVVDALLTLDDLVYMVLLLVPFCGLWLLEPLLALAVAPVLGMNLLSNLSQQTTVNYWYTAPIIPIVVAASILGMRRFTERQQRLWSRALLVFAVLLTILSPLFNLAFWAPAAVSSKHDAQAGAVALIPRGVPISATNHLGAHLADRRQIFGFPVICDAQWVVVDRGDPFVPKWVRLYTSSFADALTALRRDPSWSLVYAREAVLVFHRAGPSATGACPRSQQS